MEIHSGEMQRFLNTLQNLQYLKQSLSEPSESDELTTDKTSLLSLGLMMAALYNFSTTFSINSRVPVPALYGHSAIGLHSGFKIDPLMSCADLSRFFRTNFVTLAKNILKCLTMFGLDVFWVGVGCS